MGDNVAEGADEIVTTMAKEVLGTLIIGMTVKSMVEAEVNLKETSLIIGEEVKTHHLEGDKNNGTVMTQRTGTEIIGIETLTIKAALIEEGDGTVIEAKDTVIGEGEGIETKTPNNSSRGIPNNPNTQTPIIIVCLQWGTNMSHFNYACKMRYPLNLVLESWEYL